MQKSIKKNFVLNLVYTLTGLLFPLLAFPYVSRILLADGIGKVQFFQSIISYISIITALGIPLYAVREIARVRDNKQLCSKTAIEILLLHSILTLFGYIVVFILICCVVKIQADIPLFLLLSANLFFTTIGAIWFYQAIEDFKYIAIRSLIVRVCSLIALYIYVKTKSDLLAYAAILVIAEVGSNLFNFIRLRKFINIHSVSFVNLDIRKHLIPALRIFVLNLIISIYVNLNPIMLGFISTDSAVGFFTAATKVTQASLGIVTSLGVVLLPRLSNLAGNNKMDEFKTIANKAINIVLLLSFPITIGLIFLASPIIELFCGDEFQPSTLTLQILAPVVLFIGLSGTLGMQILYPQGKEKIVIYATIVGAVLNLAINFLLIPKYSQFGAALATLLAEFAVTVFMIICGRKYLCVTFFSRQNMHYLIGSVLVGVCLISLIHFTSFSSAQILIYGLLISVVFYFLYLFLCRDVFVKQVFRMVSFKK